ncbi:MAG: PPC domain-containing protein [Anaerolineae bacterium]|nr:PPC domain-containing protein [Anaerolineae bacterium]
MKRALLIGLLPLLLIGLALAVIPVKAQEASTPTSTVEPPPTEEPTPEPATATPTATIEPTPTTQDIEASATPTPTITAGPSQICVDPYEPNDESGSGEVLMANQPLVGLSLAPSGDVDAFQLWVKAGRYYQVDTATVEGVDTRLRLFDPIGNLLAENDDYLAGTPASRLKFQASADGWLFVSVDSVVPIDWGCRLYNIAMTDVSAPTPTPTTTPEPPGTPKPTSAPPANTPLPELFDAYEPNYDFSLAADIGVNQVIDLNFHIFPPGHPGIDNDFFRLYVKVGQELRIETLALAPGVDTNVILYREDAASIIAGNDDCKPGEQRSCLTWSPDYTGMAYVLVGPVGLTPKGISAEALSYQLSITDLTGQPTATPVQAPIYGEPLPWPQDQPPLPADTPTPAPTQPPQLQVQTFSLAPPTPTPQPLQPIVVQLTVYYDENDNQAPDINEGVNGINMQILDSLTNRVLGQTFTNHEGHATLFVSATQEIRLTVPYLGYSQPVKPPGGAFEIRIPAIHLPSLIP